MKTYGFISFCQKERERIMSAIKKAAINIPPKMNQPDYRFQINNLFCHSLSKEFSLGGEGGTLKPSYNVGYDMIYADTIKISIKIQRELFQHENKNKKLSIPKTIIIKNCLGGNAKDKKELDLDFLMTVERGGNNNTIGFGIITNKKLKKLLTTIGEDQVVVKINNNEYDYYSGSEKISADKDIDRQSELNKIFSEGLSKTYDNILEVKINEENETDVK